MVEGVCVAGGHAWQGACVVVGCVHGRGTCGANMHGRGAVWLEACVDGGGSMCARKTDTEAGSTHPTGMHSCFLLNAQYQTKCLYWPNLCKEHCL